MEFIPNSRGGKRLCFAGYIYNKKATKKTVIQWECCLRRGQNCDGFLTTTYAYNFLKFSQYWQVLVHGLAGFLPTSGGLLSDGLVSGSLSDNSSPS